MGTPVATAFEVAGADGRPIRGNVHSGARGETRRPSVIVCHGFKGFKDWGFFPVLADRLATAGFTAVRFNFSGAGVSDGDRFDQPERFARDTYSKQRADLEAVVRWVGAERFGLVGHSRGGGAAILHAADDRRVRALVTWAAIAQPLRWDAETVRRWRQDGKIEIVNQRTGEVLPLYTDMLDDIERNAGTALDIEGAAGRIAIPWLIVHGAADEAVPVEEARRLASRARPGVAELMVLEGAGHTFGARHPWAGTTPDLERALESTVAWLARHLM